jgi:hypothetical protein
VEEPAVFGFTWPVYGLPEDDPRRTYVEFTLAASGAGTRLTVVGLAAPSSARTTIRITAG